MVVHYKSRFFQFEDIGFSILITTILISIVVFISKKLYQQEKKNTAQLIEEYRKSGENLKSTLNDKVSSLSIREREIFVLIIEGNSNKEIADKLNISLGTVKNHITSIYKKSDVSKRMDIINQI